MSAWGAGLRLWMKGSEIFPREKKLAGDCRNYCFSRTTLSQARRNKLEIILTGGEKEQQGWSEGRDECLRMDEGGGTGAKARAEEGWGREKDKGGGNCCQCTCGVRIRRLSQCAALNFFRDGNVKWHFVRKTGGGRLGCKPVVWQRWLSEPPWCLIILWRLFKYTCLT